MPVIVKLSTTFRECVPDYNPLKGLELAHAAGLTVERLAVKLGLPLDEIKIIMINGRDQSLKTEIKDGDRVAFFPPIGGG